MTWTRRDVLGSLGFASAHALWLALGCRPAARLTAPRPEVSGEVRSWLHDAIARLVGAGFASAHALAVTRQRTIAAIDAQGRGVARARADGCVLTVRDRYGSVREHATNDLSADGIAAAAKALAGDARPAVVQFGKLQVAGAGLAHESRWLDDAGLIAQVTATSRLDPVASSRIVYAASSIEIDDATVWSVAPGRDLEQRLVRIRRAATRVAWNGTRPVVSEAARAWRGKLDDQQLTAAELEAATDAALALMTVGAFDDRERAIVLEPSVAAILIDAAVHALLTTSATRRPEVARRLATGAAVASPVVTLIDDPTAPAAYGGFAFDDEGEPATAVTLVDHGRVVGRLADHAGVAAGLAPSPGRGRRPGHVDAIEPAASHLRVAAGTADREALLDDGFVLEGGLNAVVDPSSDRLVVAIARAREHRGGKATGRVYADIELVGDLAALLASFTAASSQTQTIGIRDEVRDQPRWRSIETPWLRGTAMLRARRRPA